jgi:L-aspartate oxidase
VSVRALVIGAGIAGLATALAIARYDNVVICAPPDGWREGSTYRAQGGIAAAWGEDDDWHRHLEDTLLVTRGLADPGAVRILAEEARQAVAPLVEAGIFEMADSFHPDLGREAGHSRSRILHAKGGLTGRVVSRYLYQQALSHPRIRFVEGFAEKLIVDSREICRGSWIRTPSSRIIGILAPATVLATGGYAALWQRTSNHPASVGNGLLLAYEAGAELSDLEFVQFHPTILAQDVPRGGALLLTEALRGFGAHLVNAAGERFMQDYPGQELAGRDEVARAVYQQGTAYLTLRHLNRDRVYDHFGQLADLLSQRHFDLAQDLLPVAPGAHFSMGGVCTGYFGETRVQSLYAAGEAANTGVHGANRLASNSLLEALVFSARIARHITENLKRPDSFVLPDPPMLSRKAAQTEILRRLGDIMDRHFGVIRHPHLMVQGLERLKSLQTADNHRILQLCLLIGQSALRREESRGAHCRSDFPESETDWAGHLIHLESRGIEFREVSGVLKPR